LKVQDSKFKAIDKFPNFIFDADYKMNKYRKKTSEIIEKGEIKVN